MKQGAKIENLVQQKSMIEGIQRYAMTYRYKPWGS